MNRIILIGNGFDLAHGMKTSYRDFLISYWENVTQEINKLKINEKFDDENIEFYKSHSLPIPELTYKGLIEHSKANRNKLKINNLFLKNISDISLVNWVDVEKEYYQLLKKAYRNQDSNNKLNIIKLNEDFERTKKLLYDYLELTESQFESDLYGRNLISKRSIFGNNIYQSIHPQDLSSSSFEKLVFYYMEVFKTPDNDILEENLLRSKRYIKSKMNIYNSLKDTITELLLANSAFMYFDLFPEYILFLNFNYTSLESIYRNPKDFKIIGNTEIITESIHIHGELINRIKNPLIFGFGDELDRDYKEIEELDDNRYLDNIKSVNYLMSDNYRRLLAFMNLNEYQIFVCGHSCGTSDRTLLNTLFEHDNCSSIKTFYHSRSENEDNFIDVIKNITRNFNDKAKLRDRVVNKSFCKPLRS